MKKEKSKESIQFKLTNQIRHKGTTVYTVSWFFDAVFFSSSEKAKKKPTQSHCVCAREWERDFIIKSFINTHDIAISHKKGQFAVL